MAAALSCVTLNNTFEAKYEKNIYNKKGSYRSVYTEMAGTFLLWLNFLFRLQM